MDSTDTSIKGSSSQPDPKVEKATPPRSGIPTQSTCAALMSTTIVANHHPLQILQQRLRSPRTQKRRKVALVPMVTRANRLLHRHDHQDNRTIPPKPLITSRRTTTTATSPLNPTLLSNLSVTLQPTHPIRRPAFFLRSQLLPRQHPSSAVNLRPVGTTGRIRYDQDP